MFSVILSNSMVSLILDIADRRTHGSIRDSALLQLSNILINVLPTQNDIWLILGRLYIIFQCFAMTMLLSLRFFILIDSVLINFGTKQDLKTTLEVKTFKDRGSILKALKEQVT
jgi:hypothetical protein